MYKIYCGDTLIFDDSDVQQNSFLTDIELDVEAGKAGSLAFVIYPNHPSYNAFNKLTSFITVKQNDDIVFYGRVLSSEDNLYGDRKILVEGALAFFNDSVVRPYDFSKFTYLHKTPSELLSYFISKHNEQVDITRQFTLGTVTVTLPQDTYLSPSNDSYESTLSNISKYLVDECGGFLLTRRVNGVNYIDYLSEFTTVSNQKIEFGENLLDITQTINGEDVATAIIPLGADEEVEEEYVDPETGIITIKKVRKPITIVGVIDPETHEEITVDYLVNETLADIYGIIYRTVNFDDCELRIDLYNQAKEYVQNLSMLTKSIELTALDLSKIDVDLDAFRIGTKVNVISEYHGLNDSIGVTKMKINILHPEDSQLTLGKTIETFTEGNTKEVYKTSKIIQKMNQNLEEQIQNIDLSIPNLKASWDNLTNTARIEQTDEDKLVEVPVTHGKILADCNNYEDLPNFKIVSNVPADKKGYFALYPVTEDDVIIYHPFFAKRVVHEDGGGVSWYDINDLSLATVKTDIFIIGTWDFESAQATLWSGGKSIQEAELECFMNFLARIKNIDDDELQSYAEATGLDATFGKIAILEAFVNKLFVNNLKVGSGTKTTGYYVRIAEYDEETGLKLDSPQFDIYYNGICFFSINFVDGQIKIGDYEHGNGLMYDHSSNQFNFKGTGDFSGRLNTPTIQTIRGSSETVYHLGNFTTAENLLRALTHSTDLTPNVKAKATGTMNGKTINAISYSSITNEQWRDYRNYYSDFGIFYLCSGYSFTLSNVTITVYFTDGTSDILRERKLQVAVGEDSHSKNNPNYAPYPALPNVVNVTEITGTYETTMTENHGQPKVDKSVSNVDVYSAISERLFLNNIPTGAVSEPNRVWKDVDGFLHIS